MTHHTQTRPPDDPILRNVERTGYPSGQDPTYPKCPVCGAETDTLYVDKFANVVGCDNCIHTKDAWELLDEEEF